MAAHPITLEPDLQQKLEARAMSQRCSPEILLRDAVEQYLQREESHEVFNRAWENYSGPMTSREQYLREGEESYRHYKETGLHLTGDEVQTWLKALARGEDAELPECHT